MTIEMENVLVRRRFVTDYEKLREDFFKIAKLHIANSDLNAIKVIFADKIKSPRIFDYINSIEELLRILEKRNILSYDNVQPLKIISTQFVRDPALERTLNEYEARNEHRPLLPLFNVYDIPSGKYNREDQESGIFVTPSPSIIPEPNCFERANDHNTNHYNCTTESPSVVESSLADLLHDDTEIFIENNSPTVPKNRSEVANHKFFFVKVRKKMCSTFGKGVMGAFFGTGLMILLITISNALSVKTLDSVPQFENQPNVSGLRQTCFNQSQEDRHNEIHAQMTLYTTQPAFQLTLPGSILFSPTTSRSKTGYSTEEVREVLLEISEKLGRYWRDVARNLNVKEYDIDEIDHISFLPLKDKAFKALQIFQNKCDPTEWERKLKKALEKARRKDLAELVDELCKNRSSN